MKKRNRKLRKALLLTCCALALVAISVGATLAYLTDTEGVTNVFTVGHVDIQLKETDTDNDGNPRQNDYHLIPGEEYLKDPSITVEKDSEAAYVVAKIDVTGMSAQNNPMVYGENGLLGFGGIVTGGVFDKQYGEPAYNSETKTATWVSTDNEITLTQTVNKEGESYTFYIYFEDPVAKNTANDQTLVLFRNIEIPGEWTNDQIASVGGMQININAYAIQAAGFDNVQQAFKAGNDSNWSSFDYDKDDTSTNS